MNVKEWVEKEGKPYRQLPRMVKAAKLHDDCRIQTSKGVVEAPRGDWLILDHLGNFTVVKSEDFNFEYELP